MKTKPIAKHRERGTILVVVLIVAVSIAALATLSSGRVVAETARQGALEDETRAYNQAYAQLHVAMNVVNNAMYDEANHNLVLRAATGSVGIQAAQAMTDEALLNELGSLGGAYQTSTTRTGSTGPDLGWLANPEGVQHGMIPGTTVRVYRGRDYIQRLQKLNGEPVEAVDPFGASGSYFVLEAAGRSGSTIRLVSALVRENEPFSSFVFFQNSHTLGVSGKPRGLIHANEEIAFYFPNGSYVDGVTAVDGFDFRSGASQANTNIMNGNPEAAPITLENVDWDELKAKANLYLGEPGLDAEILFFKNGSTRITPYTPPRWELIDHERTRDVLVGYTTETSKSMEQVQVGTTTEERTREVISGYTTETYTVEVPVYSYEDQERSREVPVYETQDVEKTREVALWDTRTVTKTRQVKVFVPYEDTESAEGGTTVAGSGVAGEYQWVTEEYQVEEDYISGYTTETYTEQEQVQVGTTTETWTETVQVQTGTTTEERTREVPVYETETYYEEVPVYEKQMVETTEQVPVYETETYTVEQWQWNPPVPLGYEMVWTKDESGVIYVDGRILSISGDLDGQLTVVSTDKVRIDGDIQYVDSKGETVMLNGKDYSQPYVRNPDYQGDSVLGVIAKDDILFTSQLANSSEINGTLMSIEGRVGIDGFAIDQNGEPTKKYKSAWDDYMREIAYEKDPRFRTRRFTKDSMRRIGGLISQQRIMETYIRPRRDGTAYVDAGFKRGRMMFDINVLFNPPPNFVEIPRPVLINFAPIFLVRNHDS